MNSAIYRNYNKLQLAGIAIKLLLLLVMCAWWSGHSVPVPYYQKRSTEDWQMQSADMEVRREQMNYACHSYQAQAQRNDLEARVHHRHCFRRICYCSGSKPRPSFLILTPTAEATFEQLLHH